MNKKKCKTNSVGLAKKVKSKIIDSNQVYTLRIDISNMKDKNIGCVIINNIEFERKRSKK